MCCIIDCSLSGVTLFILFLLALFKIYNNVTKGIYKGLERMEGKTVIVTGASAGIGVESAKDLARRGARVVMLCRDLVKGEKIRQEIIAWTGNKNIALKYIDFSSIDTIRKCANEILSEEPRIDVLLNNAGAAGLGLNKITSDGMEILMQTNHFGPFLFMHLLMERLKQSSPARIVNVSSIMHKYAKLDLDDLQQRNVKREHTIYSNSKLAMNLCTMVLAEKLKGTGVTVNCLHPGVIKTEITRKAGYLFQAIWNGIARLFFKNAWEGAQTSIFLCVSPSVENVSGKYFSECKQEIPSRDSLDMALATKMYELSEKAVFLKK